MRRFPQDYVFLSVRKIDEICILVNCCACCATCVCMWPTVLAYKSKAAINEQAYTTQQAKICLPDLAMDIILPKHSEQVCKSADLDLRFSGWAG